MMPIVETKPALPPGDKVPPPLIVTEPALLKGPVPARVPEPETVTAVPPRGASTWRMPPETRVLPVYVLLVGPESDWLAFVKILGVYRSRRPPETTVRPVLCGVERLVFKLSHIQQAQ